MAHQSNPESNTLRSDILEELEQAVKRPVIKPQPWRFLSVTRTLIRIRKWQSGYYNPPPARPGSPDTGGLTEGERRLYAAFEACRQEHRGLSSHYAAQYKGSYVLNYNLAVIAVSLAVLSLVLLPFGMSGDEHWRHSIHMALFVLGGMKFLLLLVILINTRQANGTEFNQRAITYRYLMEQLRCMYYLPLFGMRRIPGPSAGAYISLKLKSSYLEKYFRRTVGQVIARAEEGAPVEIDYTTRLKPLLQFVQEAWIKAQMQYHEGNKEKQEALNERLEKRVNRLNLAVLIAVGIDILWGAAGLAGWIPAGANAVFHHWGTPLILMSATIIPALVASYNALRFQTEARRLGERSGSMVKLLQDLLVQYGLLIKRIADAQNEAGTGSFTGEAMDLLTTTAQVMIDEVTEWTFIYSREVLDAG